MLSGAISKAPKKEEKNPRPPPDWFLEPPLERPKPKDWISERPRGLYFKQDVISDETHAKLLAFFSTTDWIQRFGKTYPKTAHYNYFYTSIEATDPEGIQAEFKNKYPELYEAAHETFESIKSEIPRDAHPAFDTFLPETVSVHKHCPGWGLGAHYDNSADEGAGLVLMLNVVDGNLQDSRIVNREFLFTDPPGGRKFSVFTPAKMGLVFTGNAYDFWRHESIRNKKQTVTNYSITIRLKSICGYRKRASDGLKYKPGAPAAEKVAHQRIASIRAAGKSY
jgi:hypothetical protein